MSFEWVTKKLEDVSINLNNKRIPLSSRERENLKKIYPYYGAQGIIDYVDNYIFDGEFLLIAEDGENLKSRKQNIANIAKGKFWVNNHAHILKNNDESDLYYLYYYLNSIDISGYITGSVQPKLSKANLNSITIVLPSLKEQKNISDVLRALDDKIELNNAINKNLEEMAQALFKRWFVDFEFPNENGEPYKSSGGEFEESELGLIPKGWKICTLGEFCEISTTSINPAILPDIIFEHYSLPAFDSGRLPVFESGCEIKSNKYKVSKNSILVSKLNPETKRIWNPYCLTEYAICSTEFMNYIPINSRLRAYSYSILNSEGFHQYLVGNTTGSTNSRQRVNPKATLQYKFVYGGTDIAYIFNDLVSAIYKKINENTLENKYLASTRDTLLPKLMSGEIRVPVERDHSAPDLPMVAESSTIYQP